MSKIYFVRHGQTVWNVENKICGVTDSELTPLGHQQAMIAGENLKAQGLKIDKILHSPLTRARDTAGHISQITGIPMEVEPRLKEQNFGKWEATPRDGEEFQKAKRCFIDSFQGGESMMQMAQRIYNLLDELKADIEHTYLLVAHNGISRVVNSYFHDMTNEEYSSFGIGNCEIREYTFK